MAEETEENLGKEEKPVEALAPEEKKPVKAVVPKKKGGWFQKIPPEILLSPGGVVLVFFALIIEIVDWIPLPVADQIWELPLEIGFIILLVIIVKDIDWKALVIPFIIERIPGISDIVPTWLIKIFV
ncbi:MAG: hypothetical protein Q8N87_01030 [bacterium]|nr:hypothetical protein [bacterium]